MGWTLSVPQVMNPPSQEETLFQAAVRLGPAERAAFLARECDGNPSLRARLDALLAAHDQPDTLESPDLREPQPSITPDRPQTPAVDGTVGLTIGRYRLLERLGEGGCGVVYVAEQTEPVRRRVALKLIKPGMDSRAVIARFEAERQALALMDHPNIAKVLDGGMTDTGRPYFVMELVRGIRITEYCDQEHLAISDRLDLFIKVCHAIQHAHQKGIIHRDIKPSNILVTLHDGVPVPKVIDFGIAKATEGRLTEATVYTQLHQFLGTPAYMSPEQAEMSGLDIDTRSDIYSLGVLLYELLTGVTPFDAKELMSQGLDVMRRTIREKEPVRPSTRLTQLRGISKGTRLSIRESRFATDLDWIVMKCLEKDRVRRYETANGLAADLKRHLANEPVVARPPSATYRLRKAWRRNRLVFSAGAVVVLGLVIAAASLGIAERQSRSAVEAAREVAADRLHFAIMGCDPEEAEQFLQLAEKSGLPEPRLRFLRALHRVADSQPEKAHGDLAVVRRVDPRNLTALALFATTTLSISGWGAYEKLLPELARTEPRTPEEKLFVGYALFGSNQERAVALIEQSVNEEGSPLARVLLAKARMQRAEDSRDLDLMRKALDDLSGAAAWKPRAVRVLVAAVEIHSAAAKLHRHAGDTDAERHQLDLASRAIGQLEQFHPGSLRAVRARLEYLISQGSIDAALDLALRSSRQHPGAQLEKVTAHLLGLHGRYREAMVLARSFKTDPVMRAVHFLAAIELGDGLEEARASAIELSSEPPADLNAAFAGSALNLLLGDTNRSARVAGSFLANQGVVARLAIPSSTLRVVRYLAGEMSEENLLGSATTGNEQTLCHHFVGLQRLARGDRAAARDHFRRSVEVFSADSPAKHISRHILNRISASQDWPPTIAVASRGGSLPSID